MALSTRTVRVVALRASGLGDLLTVVPALRALAHAHPGHDLTLVTTPALAPLAPLIGCIDSVVTIDGLGRLPSTLQGSALAVNLHGSGPQSHRVLLASAPKRLLAHRHAAVPESHDGPPWIDGVHDARRWARLLEAFDIPCDACSVELRVPPVKIGHADGAVVVHPGAGYASRRWPLRRWAAVVQHLLDQGDRVVLTGSAMEHRPNRILCQEVGLPSSANLAGRTGVAELASVVSHSAALLSADTGIAHLAVAFGIPSVTIFGPTPPGEWGPTVRRDIHEVLWAGQRGDPHADRPDQGLLLVEVRDVIDAAARVGALRVGSRLPGGGRLRPKRAIEPLQVRSFVATGKDT